METLRHQQHRDTTKRNYYTVWRIFSNFFVRLDRKLVKWEDCLTLFVVHLINTRKQSSTVKSYISVIKSVLRDCNIKLQEDQYLITSLTRTCKLKSDQIRNRLPLQKGILGILLRHLSEKYCDQPYLAAMYKALFSTMYFGLLRISEVALCKSQHAVLARDVHIGWNKKKFLLILRTSKTHWKNMKPQMIKISALGINNNHYDNINCPYQLLRQFTRQRGGYSRDEEPFFVLSDKSPLTESQVTTTLKTILQETGFDSALYTSHSLRTGRTCDLLKIGLSVETIKKIGHWKLNAVYRYLRY